MDRKRVNTIDALICNPRLVETGLDLVQFSTVVFLRSSIHFIRFGKASGVYGDWDRPSR
jgi:hypothetical protein